MHSANHNKPLAKQPANILVVEDEPEIAKQIQRVLASAGYAARVSFNAKQFVQELKNGTPDLCIIDLGLPDRDGLELVKLVKTNGNLRVLILSGRSHVAQKITGLELGADDYMVKPFDHAELIARVRTLLKKHGQAGADHHIAKFADWQFNTENSLLESSRSGLSVLLSKAEAELLNILLHAPNRVLTRERLAENQSLSSEDRSIDLRISRLRKKLTPDTNAPEIIKTIYGAGYMFLAQVEWQSK